MERRHFVKLCSSAATLAATGTLLKPDPVFALDNPQTVKLVDTSGKPVKASNLITSKNYIFHYPYQGSPCLLLALDKATQADVEIQADGAAYHWPGGVGPHRTIVAYSAICSHALSYNTKAFSIISYHTRESKITGKSDSITCCAHGSSYDPAVGARVTVGPAPKPLAAIQLHYDPATDELAAIGMIGSDVFKRFFKIYKRDLRKEYGRGIAKQPITETALVLPSDEYSKQVISC